MRGGFGFRFYSFHLLSLFAILLLHLLIVVLLFLKRFCVVISNFMKLVIIYKFGKFIVEFFFLFTISIVFPLSDLVTVS
jgi:hypothetical protein